MNTIKRYRDHEKHGHLPAKIWVLVMDSERAQFFTKDPDALEPMLIPVNPVPMTASPLEKEKRSDPGRVYESVGHQRHAVEQMNPREEKRKRFVQKVAASLHQALEQKDFDELIIVAPNKVLGTLRPLLDGAGHHVTAEIGKDLTRAPLKALSLYLAEQHLI